MQISFAPLEGVTTYIFRNAHQKLYGGVTDYYTPFLTVRQTRKWKTRERRDIDPKRNTNPSLVPQILTNDPSGFLWAARNLSEMGYHEVNLNLGCPSATVVKKHKGAGFLEDPDRLDRFFEEVFDGLSSPEFSGIHLSVKTRIGLTDPSEMKSLLPVFNRYPLHKLIVHPRTMKDFYTGSIHMDVFRMAFEDSKNPVVYNGDIVSVKDYQKLIADFPDLQEIMIGRGLIRHPDFAERILWTDSSEAQKDSLTRFHRFHDLLLSSYVEEMQEVGNALDKMKDLWFFWKEDFPDQERAVRKIRKAKTLPAYQEAVQTLWA